MVWKTLVLYCNKPPVSRLNKSSFVDRLRLTISGGPGGSGYPKIHGVGGHGGSVFIEVKSSVKSLAAPLQQYPERRVKAGAGAHSTPQQLLGQPGKDVTVQVPPGVTVTLEINNKQHKEIADLVKDGDRVEVARGGEGGSPRNAFLGRKGSQATIALFLKLIADVGFVGFPNAGKSTLLRALSRAKPKVANYPFTTIRPNIGIVEYDDFRRLSCADLPGLIEGAHRNVGLGHSFLRHVERTRLLLFVVDVHGFQLNERMAKRDAFETVMSLNKELEMYNSGLVSKPAVLVVNKMDMAGADEKAAELTRLLECQQAFDDLPEEVRPDTKINFLDTIQIAAKNVDNVEHVKQQLRKYLDDIHEAERVEQDAAREPPVAQPRLVDKQLI